MAIEGLTNALSQFFSDRSNLASTVAEEEGGVDFAELMDDLSNYLEDSAADVSEVLGAFEGISPVVRDAVFEKFGLDLNHALPLAINEEIPDITHIEEAAISAIQDPENVTQIAALNGNILPPVQYLSEGSRSEDLLSDAEQKKLRVAPYALTNSSGKPLQNSRSVSESHRAIAEPSILNSEQEKINVGADTFTDILGSNEQQKLAHEGQQKTILDIADAQVNTPSKTLHDSRSGAESLKIGAEPPVVNNSLANIQTSVTSKESVPPMDRQLGQMGWNQDLTERILWMANKSIKAAEIRINPPQLGPIEIRINMNQDQANIYFSSQHAVVREAIESAIPKLREMFGNQQLNVLDVDVSDQSFAERREHTDNTGSQYQESAIDSMADDQELETIAETVIETNVITEGRLSFYV